MLKELLSHWQGLRVQTQLIVLLVLATLVAQAVNIGIQVKLRSYFINQERLENSYERIAAAADFMLRLPREQRKAYLSSLNLGRERYVLEQKPLLKPQYAYGQQIDSFTPFLQKLSIPAEELRLFVGNSFSMLKCHEQESLPELLTPPMGHYSTHSHPCYAELIASVHIPTLGWLNISHNLKRPIPLHSWHYWLTNLLTLITSILVIVYALRSLLKPLGKLQIAVKQSGHNMAPVLVKEQGADDIRSLINEYNQMQQRISRFVTNRTQLLAAISHDLRTPITAMRLRVEFLPDSEDKSRLLETLEQLSATADASLNFVRETKSDEAFVQLDLIALAEAICDDLIEAGEPVHWDEEHPLPAQAICYCQPNALRRAINNLIQNAVKYGQQAEVSVSETSGNYLIQIIDHGPGIPATLQEKVFEPFVRLETSRNHETGGAGLGLAIVRTIADNHAGHISFHHTKEGFVTQLELPKGV